MNCPPHHGAIWGSRIDLACPNCGAELSGSEESASCSACHTQWVVSDGVPVLCRQPHEKYLADELSPLAATQLLDMAATLGWRQALEETLRLIPAAEAEYLQRYVDTTGRALLLELLRLGEEACVLDHGCGWGNVTSQVARRVGAVVAMDMVSHRARFTALRARQEALSNVAAVVTGDYPRLPFTNGCFDAVIINGVLEWVPYSLPGNPGRIQLDRLREAHRVLRPGGQLLLAIENRFWWQYFLGRPEVHTGLRWASLLPRALARIVYRRTPFRAYTYSLVGLRRLLRRAGFGPVECFLVAPEYNFPTSVLPADDSPAQHQVFDNERSGGRKRLVRLAIDFGLYRHFAYCFAAVATRPET